MSARRALVAVVVAVVLLPGCAGLPDSGEVTEVDGSRIGEQPLTQINPPGPTRDATPVQVVRGFIEAMRAFPVSTDTAAQFLTEEAADAWRPQRQTVIYDDLSVAEPSSANVHLSVRRIATLDARGAYTPAENRLLGVDHRFALLPEKGEWRIDNPPDQIYVNADFFAAYYLPLSLHFLDLSGDVLVPDPIYLPRGEQLATSLVRGLLEGPTSDLADQVFTVVPPDTQVDGAVPVRPDGVAEVRLSSQVLELSDQQREQLSAQLVWTLRQVSGIVGVRILADGVPLDVPGVEEVQRLNVWDGEYAPYDPSAGGELFALRNGRLVSVSQTTVSPYEGMWRDPSRELADFGVVQPASQLAAVTTDRSRVLVVPVSSNRRAQPTTIYRGGHDLTDPTWDANERLWVVEQRARGSRMLLFHPLAEGSPPPQRIPMGPLDRRRVEAFALSPDGLRFAAIARTVHPRELGPRRVVLGTVAVGGGITGVQRVADVHDLETSGAHFETPIDVGWTDGTTVTVLARIGPHPPQPYEVRIDGSQVLGGVVTPEPLLGAVGAITVATSASPDSFTYVGDRRGGLWFQDVEGQWVRVSRYPLLMPDYPA